MDRYFYQIGDEVTFIGDPNTKGKIIRQLSMDEESGEPKDELDVNNQWYNIDWTEGPEGFQPFIGFERLESLVPAFVCQNSTRILNYLYDHDRELWERVSKLTQHIVI